MSLAVVAGILGTVPPMARLAIAVALPLIVILMWQGVQEYRGVCYEFDEEKLIARSNSREHRVEVKAISDVKPSVFPPPTGFIAIGVRPIVGLRVIARGEPELFITPTDRREFRRVLLERAARYEAN